MSSKRKITEGKAFHLPGDDIDTDRIIPARFLRCVTFDGLGKNVFADDREQANGEHQFDTHQGKGFNILVVDKAFGSGSSREHAPVAINQWGIDAIIGKSFAEIFFGNSVGNGIPCVTVTEDDHRRLLLSLKSSSRISLDLEKMEIQVEGFKGRIPCHIDSGSQQKLITGQWDNVATCLEDGDAIDVAASGLPYPMS